MHIHEYILRYHPEYHTIETYPADRVAPIRRAADEWGILGNMHRSPIVVDGVTFPTGEHLFQIMKFSDTGIRQALLSDTNPMTMKRFKVKKYERLGMARPDWGEFLVDSLKFCLTRKYEQDDSFRAELERSRGLSILEDETNRQKGKAADSYGAVLSADGRSYVGPNLLGRLLMELRDKDGHLDYSLPAAYTGFADLLP